ncbi:hypothetical protein CsatB_020886 [Cannabis sativa]
MEADGEDAVLRGQVEIWKYMLSFADSMALKCAVELQLGDIIHSHTSPITLSQIASAIPGATSPDLSCLASIMRLLVRRRIFTQHQKPKSDGEEEEALYGPTHSSRWLLTKTNDHDQLTLAPMILMENDPRLMAPWHCFSRCVKEGGVAFKKAHNGQSIWEFGAENPEINKLFNDAMECTAKVVMKAILSHYSDGGFSDLKSMVDVGGGTGGSISEIVRSYPHIKGINFDLPHVIATAPPYSGVSHVGGDMFRSVPTADAIFMKWILHDWSDEDCVKILKNCRKAIAEESGKVIIVESVLEEESNNNNNNNNEVFGDTALVLDLVMVAHTTGGKERTQKQWKTILEQGGFPRYNFIKIKALPSIIEAYPN